MKKLYILIFGLLIFHTNIFSQTADWKFRYEYVKGNSQEVDVFIDISIPTNFHMYSFNQGPGGPIPAEIIFKVPAGVKKIGALQSLSKVHEYYDDIFKITARDFSGDITWKQRFYVNSKVDLEISGTYFYQLCMDDGMCITPPFPIKFKIQIPKPQITSTLSDTPVIKKPSSAENNIQKTDLKDTATVKLSEPTITNESLPKEEQKESMSLLWIFIAGFIGGLLAFLTPCVFPMVPLTVSLFIKRNKERALQDVSFYALSIITIFVSLGLLITILFGVDALNKLSTDPIFNTVFFVIFVIFAISFFGAFELVLPSRLVNSIDKKADSNSGYLGIFFMAFTLVLVSFSCTAMIIGTLLVQSVVSGSLMGPFMGMLGFSIALALPFALFGFFPSLLHKMPKSGNWMNTFKVVLGFIELGFALKFLSNADLVANWNILPRPIFLGIWIILMIALSLYLFNAHTLISKAQRNPLSKLRILFAIISIVFTGYLFTGYFGNNLATLSGYLPPISNDGSYSKHKYSEYFHSPYGIQAFYDYEEGMEYAKQTNKPVLLDFTGKACANCRLIEMNVWSNPEILKILKEDYVVISLYVDSRDPIEKERIRDVAYGGETYTVTTIGEHWSLFMMQNYGGLMQPYYVLLSPEGKQLAKPIAYNEAKSISNFKNFLELGKNKIN